MNTVIVVVCDVVRAQIDGPVRTDPTKLHICFLAWQSWNGPPPTAAAAAAAAAAATTAPSPMTSQKHKHRSIQAKQVLRPNPMPPSTAPCLHNAMDHRIWHRWWLHIVAACLRSCVGMALCVDAWMRVCVRECECVQSMCVLVRCLPVLYSTLQICSARVLVRACAS